MIFVKFDTKFNVNFTESANKIIQPIITQQKGVL